VQVQVQVPGRVPVQDWESALAPVQVRVPVDHRHRRRSWQPTLRWRRRLESKV
jgi:hypothetical protein